MLFLACYVTGGWEPGWAGLQALRNKTLDVDLLMVAAAVGAAAIGRVLDGGLLIVIFAVSGALEADRRGQGRTACAGRRRREPVGAPAGARGGHGGT
ncbi:MAG TPA: hypothetical protein VFW64_17425 [Pseudonocardiaceae bacterium]|nr:hypothetical protein [Pseudonocardiaceae bacterium]